MIAAIIRWSARHAWLVVMATLIPSLAGLYAVKRVPLDAIPDLSDVQVIVTAEYPGQSPQVVEDQLTFPLTTALLNTPRARVVRGVSYPNTSFVHVIFAEGTDPYWARARVQEQLGSMVRQMPDGVVPKLGADATGVGWIYQYVITAQNRSLAELRSTQDWRMRLGLAGIEGVAEIASVGGHVKSYSVTVDPNRLRALGVTLAQVRDAVRASNLDTGARTIEIAESEFAVQGRGYLKSPADIEIAVVKMAQGVPVLIKDVARVELAAEERRGLAERDGQGEVVSGIVVQRPGTNTLDIIAAVKQRISEIASSLPAGILVEAVYDRSGLIHRAIDTIQRTLTEEVLVVTFICWIFLRHFKSALIPIWLLIVSILTAYVAMFAIGVSTNIMSLGGIAIAAGAMVDAALVMVENAHKRLDRAESNETAAMCVVQAAAEVGPALFNSLFIITVSFLPILTLELEEGRLFRPLAYTKTLAMAAAALLSVTLVPALMTIVLQKRRDVLGSQSMNRWLIAVYRPLISGALANKWRVLGCALAMMAASVLPLTLIGHEFMPPLNEGALLFMPTMPPGISNSQALALLQAQDRIIKSFPEVESVLGKAGRATSATDPAPMEMFETLITLKPASQWRQEMTSSKLVSQLDTALHFPGVSNSWTTPVRGRIDMLSTGIRTLLGVKIFGNDLRELDRIATEVATAVKSVRGTTSAFAERVLGGRYLNITPDRTQIARYGLTVGDIQAALGSAIGGDLVTTMVEGRERYGVMVRYPRDLRTDPAAIGSQILVSLPGGSGTIPLASVAKISLDSGAASIRSENARPVAYVLIDFKDRDLGGYVQSAKAAVAASVRLPAGYALTWSGQYEHLERAQARLAVVVSGTLLITVALLYATFWRWVETAIVMLSLPFALIGGTWLMWLLGHNFSVASIVGFIALAGVATETGIVMLIYLDQAYRAKFDLRQRMGEAFTTTDLADAIQLGAIDRIRPKIMTVTAIVAGLLPILWSGGAGAEVIQRIAVPMIGGMISSAILTLIVIPVVYAVVKEPKVGRRG